MLAFAGDTDYLSMENRKAFRFDQLQPDTVRFIQEVGRARPPYKGPALQGQRFLDACNIQLQRVFLHLHRKDRARR